VSTPPKNPGSTKPWAELTREEQAERMKLFDEAVKLPDAVPIVDRNTPTIMEERQANERQVGGAHYRTSMQHWDYVWVNDLDYFQGQITKYVTRWKRKGGIQDLEKAKHFLDKYIELVSKDCEPDGRYVAQGHQR
jgi:hypothetical protein